MFFTSNVDSFLQVRHPLERLLSTWRYIFQSKAWRQILTAFPEFNAGAILRSDRRLLDPSWPDFVTHILLDGANREGLTPGRLDAEYGRLWTRIAHHFAPYWLWCGTCQPGLRPDIILKMETLERDGAALMRMLNLTAVSEAGAQPPFERVHVVGPEEGADGGYGVHSKTKVAEYYGQLTRRQVMDLYEMYRLDHELFNYSPDKYLALAKE
jgi:hypothetical protein